MAVFGATVAQELLGKSWLDLVHPSAHHLVQAHLTSLAEQTGAAPMMDTKFIKLNGSEIDLEVHCRALVYDGQPAIQCYMRDVTERNAAQSEQRWAALLFANIQDGAVVTDKQGSILAINPAFTAMSGYSETELIGANMRLMQSGRQGRDFYVQMWQSITLTGGWAGEIWNRRKNGEIYLERLAIHVAYDATGEIANYVSTSTDLTRYKHADQMEHLAHHDTLTGLPNRFQLMLRLQHALDTSKRSQRLGAVLFFDLDHFKRVNDTWGHPAGDELLQQVARRVGGRLRDTDLLARMGGDEFVVVLESVDALESVGAFARDLIQLISQPFVLTGGYEATIGASVGIAMLLKDGNSTEALLRHADMALYRAKAEGRNTFCFYDAE
jgi:diguanylate cyclase (GGDEF)-like protein/PAS domain S-box-containing protein